MKISVFSFTYEGIKRAIEYDLKTAEKSFFEERNETEESRDNIHKAKSSFIFRLHIWHNSNAGVIVAFSGFASGTNITGIVWFGVHRAIGL